VPALAQAHLAQSSDAVEASILRVWLFHALLDRILVLVEVAFGVCADGQALSRARGMCTRIPASSSVACLLA